MSKNFRASLVLICFLSVTTASSLKAEGPEAAVTVESMLESSESTPEDRSATKLRTPPGDSTGLLGAITQELEKAKKDHEKRLKKVLDRLPEKQKEVEAQMKLAQRALKENNPRILNKYIGGVENPADVIEEHSKDFLGTVLPEFLKINPLGEPEGCPSYTVRTLRACVKREAGFGCVTFSVIPPVSYRFAVDKIENTAQAFTSRYVPEVVFNFSKQLLFGSAVPVSDLLRIANTDARGVGDLASLFTNKLRVTIQMKQDMAQTLTLLAAKGILQPGSGENVDAMRKRFINQISNVKADDAMLNAVDKIDNARRGFNGAISKGAYLHSEFRVVPEIFARLFQEKVLSKITFPWLKLIIRVCPTGIEVSVEPVNLNLTCHNNKTPHSPNGNGEDGLTILNLFTHVWGSDLASMPMANFPSGGYTVTRFPFFVLLDSKYKDYRDAVLQFFKNPFQCSNISALRNFFPKNSPDLLGLKEVAGKLNDVSGLISADLNKAVGKVPEQYQACMKEGMGSYLPFTNSSPTKDRMVAAAAGVLKGRAAYLDNAENFYTTIYNRAKTGISSAHAEVDKIQWIPPDWQKTLPKTCMDPEISKEVLDNNRETAIGDPGITAVHWRQLQCCPLNGYKPVHKGGLMWRVLRQLIPGLQWFQEVKE